LVQVEGEPQIYVPLRPICEYLGLAWSAQTRRIRRDPVLNKWATFVAITATNPEEARKGGNPNMLCLPLDYLNGTIVSKTAPYKHVTRTPLFISEMLKKQKHWQTGAFRY